MPETKARLSSFCGHRTRRELAWVWRPWYGIPIWWPMPPGGLARDARLGTAALPTPEVRMARTFSGAVEAGTGNQRMQCGRGCEKGSGITIGAIRATLGTRAGITRRSCGDRPREWDARNKCAAMEIPSWLATTIPLVTGWASALIKDIFPLGCRDHRFSFPLCFNSLWAFTVISQLNRSSIDHSSLM
jgi:hypothetical protein